ncbi:MAG: H-type lectin domain-containing protein [Rubellimicrobium sp.]|nr:H-type lectin domain-containing protein [Rubellimicrobium sp.]
MRRFRSHTLGVDEGEVPLFDDFEHSGPMWTERGVREVDVAVAFAEGFAEPPSVRVWLVMWDMASSTNSRVDLRAVDVSRDGFTIRFRTWDDSRIARARAAWQAIGPLRDDDDWEVD